LHPPPSEADTKRIVETIVARNDSYAQASIAAMLLGPHRFTSVLRGAVYGECGFNFDELRDYCAKMPEPGQSVAENNSNGAGKYGFLCSVARLCLRREVVAVVTYNYDTLLEQAVEFLSKHRPEMARQPISIGRQIAHAVRAQTGGQGALLPVYHVHGCLHPPRRSRGLADVPVVISQRDYARAGRDPHSLEDSSQLHFLRSYPCLFLGLSMVDWDILRLLEATTGSAEKTSPTGHLYCVGANENSEVEWDELHSEVKRRLLGTLGVSAAYTERGRFDQLWAFTDAVFCKLQLGD
jgi:hypothetical protein